MYDSLYICERKDTFLIIDLHNLSTFEVEKGNNSKQLILEYIDSHPNIKDCYEDRLVPLENMNYSFTFSIVTGFDCNYQCDYCYQRAGKGIQSKMTPSDISLIRKWYSIYAEEMNTTLHIDGIGLIGGEPLLPDNRDTIEKIVDTWPQIPITITTNGTYISDYIDIIIKEKMHIRVSLDGDKKLHYSKRKSSDKYAYEKAISGIKSILDNGGRVDILSVFSPNDSDEYSSFFDELELLGWGKNDNISVMFNPLVGAGCDDISDKNIVNNISALKALRLKDERVNNVNVSNLFPGLSKLLDSLEAMESGFYQPYRCSCLCTPCYSFLPDGRVVPCLTIPNIPNELCVGSFKPQVTLNKNAIDRLLLRRTDKMDECKDCTRRTLCKGGCLATALSNGKDINKPFCSFWKDGNYIKYIDI